MIVTLPLLFLISNAVNAAPLHSAGATRDSNDAARSAARRIILKERQFDLGGIGDFFGFGGDDSSGDSSSGDGGSSFGDTVGKVTDFLGLGGGDDNAAPAAAPAASGAAAPAQDDSFGSQVKKVADTVKGVADTAGKVADFLGLGDDDKDAAAAAAPPAPAPAAPAAPAPAPAAPPAPAPAPPAPPAAVAAPPASSAAADPATGDNAAATENNAAAATGTCGAPGINTATVDLIKSFEGFVASPEPDPIGLPTVGFGHLCKSKGCAEVPFSFPLSQDTANQLLQTDVKPFVSCINDAVNDSVVLNDNQLGALTSWSFNVGCGAAKSSTLMKRLNAGENPNTVAAQELPKFNKAGGKVLAGLTRRRAAEVKLFQTASNVQAHPCN